MKRSLKAVQSIQASLQSKIYPLESQVRRALGLSQRAFEKLL